MVVFFGQSRKVAISLSRIYQITQCRSEISIYYDAGEITYLGDSGESVAPKIECFDCRYDSEEIAVDVMRSFYVACESNKGAFYF